MLDRKKAAKADGAGVISHIRWGRGFAYRRVKNTVRGAGDVADLIRPGRLPEA